jgi:hypothetical protein
VPLLSLVANCLRRSDRCVAQVGQHFSRANPSAGHTRERDGLHRDGKGVEPEPFFQCRRLLQMAEALFR